MLTTLPSASSSRHDGFERFSSFTSKDSWSNANTILEEKSVSFSSPNESQRLIRPQRGSLKPKHLSSVSLSCVSSDGRIVHSFGYNEANEPLIFSHSLPLAGTTGNNENSWDISTLLPSYVGEALAVDEPLALICVESDSRQCQSANDSSGRSRTLLPLLCLYSARAAFLLQIERCPEKGEGNIVHIIEPFESHLLQASPSSSCQILRIRPAPFDTVLCAPGSMAMLTNEHTLVLYHGIQSSSDAEEDWHLSQSTITTPVHLQVEDLNVENTDSLIDFAFSSNSNNIFSAMTVIFTTIHTGAVYFATPILFHGAVLPRSQVERGIQSLDKSIHTTNQPPALVRRAKAAKQYLLHAFPDILSNTTKTNQNYYTTVNIAHVNGGTKSSYRNATAWPIKMQGPLHIDREPQDEEIPKPWKETAVVAMELITLNETNKMNNNTSGLVLARANHSLDYLLIPGGDWVLPRFAFESEEDGAQLHNELAYELGGMVVERVVFGKDQTITPDGEEKISLQIDPIDSSMIHFVSSKRIITISSNAIEIMKKKIKNTAGKEQVVTTAFSTLQISTGGINTHDTSLNGVIVSSDVKLGHIMIARISNGSMEAINITASKYLHQASNLNLLVKDEDTSEGNYSSIVSVKDDALKTMEKVPPFVDIIEPFFKKITKGISGLGKIVGGSTKLENVDASSLAIFLSTKENCEEDIILPLQALQELVVARKKMLEAMYRKQVSQLKSLQTKVKEWKENQMALTKKKMATVSTNSDLLAQRSAAVLAVARELSPTITEAEYQYFTQLRRYDATCTKWQDQLEKLGTKANASKEKSLRCAVQLEKEQLDLCTTLLKGQQTLLDRNALRVKDIENKLKSIANK